MKSTNQKKLSLSHQSRKLQKITSFICSRELCRQTIIFISQFEQQSLRIPITEEYKLEIRLPHDQVHLRYTEKCRSLKINFKLNISMQYQLELYIMGPQQSPILSRFRLFYGWNFTRTKCYNIFYSPKIQIQLVLRNTMQKGNNLEFQNK
ncbi:unnamed protein product [Paramecium sonneborni]|uniref:Uncharacterized protein n=1 Tax=Paramecium sonneborni TaxID=65129 RepID=A0A8S1MGV6_9CILI|nr:unnamed protein product [Paramecium sonneborni]